MVTSLGSLKLLLLLELLLLWVEFTRGTSWSLLLVVGRDWKYVLWTRWWWLLSRRTSQEWWLMLLRLSFRSDNRQNWTRPGTSATLSERLHLLRYPLVLRLLHILQLLNSLDLRGWFMIVPLTCHEHLLLIVEWLMLDETPRGRYLLLLHLS